MGYAGRAKINPMTGDVAEVAVSSRPIYGAQAERPGGRGAGAPSEAQGSETTGQAARRAKGRVRELAACNPWEYFVTLTFDPERIDSYNYAESLRFAMKWMSNRVQRNGLKYVAVPELHKSGRLHIHALVSGGLKLVDSGHKSRGKKVYNLPDWPGFTTAVRLSGDPEKVASYLSKYILKQVGTGPLAGRYYYHGGKGLQGYSLFTFAPDADALEHLEPRYVAHVEQAGFDVSYYDPAALPFLCHDIGNRFQFRK